MLYIPCSKIHLHFPCFLPMKQKSYSSEDDIIMEHQKTCVWAHLKTLVVFVMPKLKVSTEKV